MDTSTPDGVPRVPPHPEVGARLEAVRARLERLGAPEVLIVAVTKGFDIGAVQAALAAGYRHIGENYAQELVDKMAALAEMSGRYGDALPMAMSEPPVVHFIGRLQTNKVRLLADIVDLYESVDRLSLVETLARHVPGARILIQVNTTGEAAKGGCRPDEVESLVVAATAAGLAVEGLMTVGPTDQPADAARPGFRLVRSLVDRLGLRVCSMGMSHDLEVAVEEGSTEVRLGRAIFGERVRPTSRQQ